MPPTANYKKNSAIGYEDIVRDVNAGNFKPIYYLMGEENYYIDKLADYIVDQALTEEEKDFNLITLFGAETTIENVINAAKGYPMGAERLVVVVKEAQNLKNIERLEYYLKQIQPKTVLVICHKNCTIDRRKKIASQIEQVGVLFESKKLKETQVVAFINSYLRRKQILIEPSASEMMVEYVGTDLSRMAGELDKLVIAIQAEGAKMLTPKHVEMNIGISREFNIFELQDALAKKDVLRANRIAQYFDKNPKANPIQKTLPALFRFFSNLMLAYYSPDKTPRGIAAWLGVTEWQVEKNVMPAMRNFSGVKVMKIIGEIRRTDAKSKGVNCPNTSQGDLLTELLFFILH